MIPDKQLQQRFVQLLSVVDKEVFHLQQVSERFFEKQEAITQQWLQQKLSTGTGIDQLESFTSKFSRLQDTLGDKVLPLFLKLTAEPVGTALENLHRAEKLELIQDSQNWLGTRLLRNMLVHNYVEDLSILTQSLHQAQIMTNILIATALKFKNYALKLGFIDTDF